MGRGKKFPNVIYCLVHPSVKAITSGLCSSCYRKVMRLGLIGLVNVPIDKIIAHMLSTTIKKSGKALILIKGGP